MVRGAGGGRDQSPKRLAKPATAKCDPTPSTMMMSQEGWLMTVPTTMRAVQIIRHGGPDVLTEAEMAVPVPAAGEVLVRVSAAALNNTDLWTREGAYGSPEDPKTLSGWRGPVEFPRIQGADVAGRVVSVGAGVDGSLVGRRVVVDPASYDAEGPDANPVGLMGSERDGGYAEYVTAPARQVHDMTEAPLADDQLAALPTAYGTALGMIERGRLRKGETALVSGPPAAWGWRWCRSPGRAARGSSPSAVRERSTRCARRERTRWWTARTASSNRSAPSPRKASTSGSTLSPEISWSRACRRYATAADGSSPVPSAATRWPSTYAVSTCTTSS
ncbi:hypothetical protein GCM10029963_03330 [Micromonospora andamanensis]